MVECPVCGKDVLMPFECNFCGKYFCEEHRLPENHACSGAPARTPLGSYQSKQRIASEKKTSRVMASEGNLHFEREAKPVRGHQGHFRVRAWYLFLIILFAAGMILFGLGNYYIYVLGDFDSGWSFLLCSGLVFGVLMAIGLLYFERWWKRHMRRFWGE
jgi:hypothetical protein